MVPMWSGVAGNLVNVILDVWLIFGWSGFAFLGHRVLAVAPMGVEGAAIATSLGVFVSTLVLLGAAVLPGEVRRRYRLHRARRPDLRRIRGLIHVGAPAAWENFVDMSGFLFFTAIVGTTGAVALAANQISIQLLSFSFMPLWGLTIAGSVLAGNWIGAGRGDQAAAYARQVYKLGFYYSLLLATLFVILRHELFRAFSGDPAVLAYGATVLLILAPFQICDGMRMISIGVLQGAGDTRFPMIASMIVLWGGFIPATWLIVVHLGGNVVHAWAVGMAAYAVQASVMALRFHSGAWRRIRIFGREMVVEGAGGPALD